MIRATVLFVAMAVLLSLAGPTEAGASDDATCDGRDLWAETVPGLPIDRTGVERAAAQVINGEAALWRIEAPSGGTVSHILGTMHLSDPRIRTLTPAKEAAFTAARTLALENSSAVDMDHMSDMLFHVGPLLFMPNGRNYGDLLNRTDLDQLRTALDRRGMPLMMVYGWKPSILIFSILTYAPCELARQKSGPRILDATLFDRASREGKTVANLETLDQQMAALTDIAEDAQLSILKSLLEMDPFSEDLMETEIRFYQQGRVGMLWSLSNRIALSNSVSATQLDALWSPMLDRRNAVMFANARRLVDAGPTLIAVGAGHLIGPNGLVQSFKDAGYRVTPIE